MTEEIANEKLSIRNSLRSLKKYGSTSSHVKQPVNLVKHFVSSSDTLQGIALRYGVTVSPPGNIVYIVSVYYYFIVD